jgi:two-component system chemotaxis sensor kinase CheA
MDDLLNEFINESREHLATIEADLLTIEEGGVDVDDELVNKVFRAAHSIKGGSSFFGLNKVKELSHKAETVLDMMRSRKITPNAEVTNVLLAAFDKLREMINATAESEQVDISDLVVGLSGLAASYLAPEDKASLTHDVKLHPVGDEQTTVTVPQVDFDRARRSGQHVYCIDLDLIHDIERKGKNVLSVFRDVWESGEILDCALDFEAVGTLDGPVGNQLPLRLVFATVIRPDDVTLIIDVSRERFKVLFDPNQTTPPAVAKAVPPPRAVEPSAPPPEPAPFSPPEERVEAVALRTPAGPPAGVAPAPLPPAAAPAAGTSAGAATKLPASGDSTLRVHVGLLETLMNLAGEMILSRNQLHDAIARNDTRSLSVADQRLNLVTSELQDAIMQTRLQPIGNVFAKFPRVVRDLCGLLHKEVQLDIRGHDVAMDKSLIEGLSDPLTHMVRNAVDHGIATPEERVRAGKKRQGTVRIEARHEAGQVVVEIADDGQGIDAQRVAQSALAKGLITPERLGTLTAQERLALIFLPGLSTAKVVTDVSGRGVGMDVVKTNLDRMGGKMEIQSIAGQGTTFRIKLPLTLAIIPSLIVSVDQERFAIPQVSVEELLHIRAEDIKDRLTVVGGAEVLLLRERILPLLRFAELLGAAAEDAAAAPKALEIAVVTTGSLSYGLVVGAFHDTEEIVVKPLGRHLKGLREYAGATILGDGRVALILDVAGLASKADLSAVAERALEEGDRAAESKTSHSLLLFHNAPDELCAVPLEVVLRIERIKPEQVETMGGRRTMQYRGAALPLVTLADVAQMKSLGDARDLAVIVSNVHGREVGLLGAMPVDVVETQAAFDLTTHRQKGIAGSAILDRRTALIAELPELVDAVYPDWRAQMPALPAPKPGSQGYGVLLAEDSDFFRAQVKRYLEEDGRVVFDAPDGESAWELLLQHLDEVQAVVTDIEMPRLTGLGLAQRIRGDARTNRLPIIGLSSLAGEEDVARGKAAGIDDYQVKLDRDQLLACLRGHAAQAAPAQPALIGN